MILPKQWRWRRVQKPANMPYRYKYWTVSDAFWEKVEPLLPERTRDPNKKYRRSEGAGRPPIPKRKIFEGIVYVARTGIQCRVLPKSEFGVGTAIHRYFMEWPRTGVFERIWNAGLVEYDEMEGIAWLWQSIDGSTNKAPLAQESVGPNPTDRVKNGDKTFDTCRRSWRPAFRRRIRSQHHDTRLLTRTLEAIRIEKTGKGNNLCLDAGYMGMQAEVRAHRLIPHICPRSEEKRTARGRKKQRRWVVERLFSWLNQYRKINRRYENLDVSHMGLLSLCCACIVWRQLIVIYG